MIKITEVVDTKELAALRKDAERWRWWRQRWNALCGYSCARSAGLDLRNIYVTTAEQMDKVTDAAISRELKSHTQREET